MKKNEFAKKMLEEIESLAKLGFHYQAFALISLLEQFLQKHCNKSLFIDARMKNGFELIRNNYSPLKQIWLISEETSKYKHMDEKEGSLVLDIFKTIEIVKQRINNEQLPDSDFLQIEE